jgi:hypothetical protein
LYFCYKKKYFFFFSICLEAKVSAPSGRNYTSQQVDLKENSGMKLNLNLQFFLSSAYLSASAEAWG